MTPLSSATLFHFTGRIENLIGILEHEFIPQYSLEDYSGVLGQLVGDADVSVGIPMVCFCDMPLSQAASHITTYGRYSLGLTKEWGKRAGVSPILYTYPGSATTAAVVRVHLRVQQLQGTINDGAEFSGQTERLWCFVKPYEGELRRDGQEPKRVRFYDEREWRFVPEGEWRALKRTEFMDFRQRQAANAHLRGRFVLSFDPADIRYIIVATEDEIAPMIGEVQRIKSPKYSPADISLLCSRIVSAAQVSADF